MKKLINDPQMVLSDSLAGFCAAHEDIVALGEGGKFVRRAALTPGKVALISGGGSGHEPLQRASWAEACSMPPVRARSLPRRLPTRLWPLLRL
jgi:Dak1 domain